MIRKPEIWNRVHYSCNKKVVFGRLKVLTLTPIQLDKCCEKAEVCWEELPGKEIHIHGCGIECYCHGGPKESNNLRPRPKTTDR
jgi:hypothetical protein